jgi:hypothetical protein
MTFGAFFAFVILLPACTSNQKGAHVCALSAVRNRAFVNKITHIEQGPAWRRVGNRGQKEKAKTATILPK